MTVLSPPPFRRSCLLFAVALLAAAFFVAMPGAAAQDVECTEVPYNEAIVQQCRPSTSGDAPATPTPTVVPDGDPDTTTDGDDTDADDETSTIDPRRPKDRGERGARVGEADAEAELDALAQAEEDAADAARAQDDDDPEAQIDPNNEDGEVDGDDDDPAAGAPDNPDYVPGNPQDSGDDAMEDEDGTDGGGLTAAVDTNDSSTNVMLLAALVALVAIGLGFMVAARRNRATPDRPSPDETRPDEASPDEASPDETSPD